MKIPEQYQGKQLVTILQNPSGCYYVIIPQSIRELMEIKMNESHNAPRIVTTFTDVNLEFLTLADRYAESLDPKAREVKITLQDILNFSQQPNR